MRGDPSIFTESLYNFSSQVFLFWFFCAHITHITIFFLYFTNTFLYLDMFSYLILGILLLLLLLFIFHHFTFQSNTQSPIFYYVFIYVSMYLYIYGFMCLCVYVGMHVCMYLFIQSPISIPSFIYFFSLLSPQRRTRNILSTTPPRII